MIERDPKPLFSPEALARFNAAAQQAGESFAGIGKAMHEAFSNAGLDITKLDATIEELRLEQNDQAVVPPDLLGDDSIAHEDAVWVVYLEEDSPVVKADKLSGETTVEDMWIHIEALIGDDLDPVTVLRVEAGSPDVEIMMYRKADANGKVYRDLWTGDPSGIPEELRDLDPPKESPARPEFWGKWTSIDD